MPPEMVKLSAAFDATTAAVAPGTTPQAFLQDAVCHLARLHRATQASILLLEGDQLVHGASIGLAPENVGRMYAAKAAKRRTRG